MAMKNLINIMSVAEAFGSEWTAIDMHEFVRQDMKRQLMREYDPTDSGRLGKAIYAVIWNLTDYWNSYKPLALGQFTLSDAYDLVKGHDDGNIIHLQDVGGILSPYLRALCLR